MTTTDRLREAGLLVPGVVALAGLVVLVSLGLWQLERLAWKNELIHRAEVRSQAPPEPLPPAAAWPGLDPRAYDYQAVSFAGEFRHDDEIHVYTALPNPRGPHGGPGWWIVVPLELASGHTVFVNRGFVPEAFKSPSTRVEGQVTGRVEVVGLIREPEPQGLFVPDDNPEANIWFTRDPERMANALGIDGLVAPFLVDAVESAPGGLPQGGETVIAFRNDHLGYALTWFGLAAALVAVFGAWAYGRLAGRRGGQ